MHVKRMYNINWKDEYYLKMNMNKINREKKTATLSMVLSMTKSCLRKLGINRTNFNIRSSRKVRKTLKPELLSYPSKNDWPNSIMLQQKEKKV